jgi:hypothetical protein
LSNPETTPTQFQPPPRRDLRVYPERIVVAGEGQVICEHRRVFARSHQRKSTTTVFDWRHYLAVIQRKPGALRNGAPFAELPPAFRALQQRMLKTPGGDLRRDNQDENRATIRMRMRRRGDYEGRAQPDRRNPRGGGERPSGLVWR